MPASSTATRVRRQWSVKGFSLEVAVIVAGVSIALLGEYLITEYTWSQRVERAEGEFRDEAVLASYNAAEKIVVTPCILAQLDALEAHLLDPAKRAEPFAKVTTPGGDRVIRTPNRFWPTDAWDAAVSDGTAARLSRVRRNIVASIYERHVELTAARNAREELIGSLNLASFEVERDQATNLRLLERVAKLRSAIELHRLIARQHLAEVSALGFLESDEALKEDFDRLYGLEGSTTHHCLANDHPIERPNRGWDGLMGEAVVISDAIRASLKAE